MKKFQSSYLSLTSSLLLTLTLNTSVNASAATGDAEKGRALSVTCAACHGVDGNSPAPIFPKLAGQYADYLVQTLKTYRSGDRQNPIMAPNAANLSDEDIANLAAYFASQTALGVVKKPKNKP